MTNDIILTRYSAELQKLRLYQQSSRKRESPIGNDGGMLIVHVFELPHLTASGSLSKGMTMENQTEETLKETLRFVLAKLKEIVAVLEGKSDE